MDGKLDTAMLGKSLDHGVNDLSHRWRQELDRSIAKHMEKGKLSNLSWCEGTRIVSNPRSAGLFLAILHVF